MAAWLPADVAKFCVHLESTGDERELAAIDCRTASIALNLRQYENDSASSDGVYGLINECSGDVMSWEHGEDYAVGARRVGGVDGCVGESWFAWYVNGSHVFGIVDAGSFEAGRAWFRKTKPYGPRPGLLYGWGASPTIPAASFASLLKVAQRPSYKPLLRAINKFEGHLVRFKGRVSVVDDDQVYADVTPAGYGFYKDTVILDTSKVGGRMISDDIIEFVGFVTGTEDYFLGPVPGIEVVAYKVR